MAPPRQFGGRLQQIQFNRHPDPRRHSRKYSVSDSVSLSLSASETSRELWPSRSYSPHCEAQRCFRNRGFETRRSLDATTLQGRQQGRSARSVWSLTRRIDNRIVTEV